MNSFLHEKKSPIPSDWILQRGVIKWRIVAVHDLSVHNSQDVIKGVGFKPKCAADINQIFSKMENARLCTFSSTTAARWFGDGTFRLFSWLSWLLRTGIRHVCMCSTQSSTVGGSMQHVGLQTANMQEAKSHSRHWFMFAAVQSVYAPVESTSMHSGVFFIVMHVVFNFSYANKNHLAIQLHPLAYVQPCFGLNMMVYYSRTLSC